MKLFRTLLFPALDWIRPKDPPMSLGHASIIANLLKNNVPVIHNTWSVNSSEFSPHEVVNFVMEHASEKTDFAIGAFIWNEAYIQFILNELEKYKFPGRRIIGGPQVSYLKRDLEHFYPKADIFIRGYAEEALSKLLTSSEPFPAIKGVHYAGQFDLGLSATPEFGSLPSPFLTQLVSPERGFIRWETQRGCPFECSFCQHRESDPSKKRKHFALPRIAQEVNWITEHTTIRDIAVLDPIFNSGEQYLQVLSMLIENKYRGKLALQCRAEMVRPEFLKAVEELNQTAEVKLEFGLQTTHKEEQKVIQRGNNLSKVKSVLEETVNRGIDTEVSLIYGLPMQTLSSFKQSIDFCTELGVSSIKAFPLMLLRGTPLFEQKDALKLVESSDINIPADDTRIYNSIPTVISSPSFTSEDWEKMSKLSAELETYNNKPKPANKASFFQPTSDMQSAQNTKNLMNKKA